MAYNKYQKLVLQVSNDGVNWITPEPRQYKKGNVIEEESIDCGGGGTETKYRWTVINDEYVCINNDKYQKTKKQVWNFDSGEWEDVVPLETSYGELLEINSSLCDYAEEWKDTDKWECVDDGDDPTPPGPTPSDYFKVYLFHDEGGSLIANPSKTEYQGGEYVKVMGVPNVDYSLDRIVYGSTPDYGLETYDSVLNLRMTNDWYVSAYYCESSSSPFGDCYVKATFTNGQTSIMSYDGSIIGSGYGEWGYYGIWSSVVNAKTYGECITSVDRFHLHELKAIDFSTVEYISRSGFWGALNLVRVNLPKLKYIGEDGFWEARELEYINCPELRTIDCNAFAFCKNLKEISLPNLKFLSSLAFQGCGLTNISLPLISNIYSGTFYACNNLKSVYLMGSEYVRLSTEHLYGTISTYVTPFKYCNSELKIYVPCSLYQRYIDTTSSWLVELEGQQPKLMSLLFVSSC